MTITYNPPNHGFIGSTLFPVPGDYLASVTITGRTDPDGEPIPDILADRVIYIDPEQIAFLSDPSGNVTDAVRLHTDDVATAIINTVGTGEPYGTFTDDQTGTIVRYTVTVI